MIVNMAVIGGGVFGSFHLKALKCLESTTNNVKLVALADNNEKVLKEQMKRFGIKGYSNYQEMLDAEKIDAVTIATPDYLHREIAINVANAGKHILVEKPLDITIEGCNEIIEAAHRNNVFLEVDFHKRYDPHYKLLEKLIREGQLGKILYGYVHAEDRINVPTKMLRWADKTSPVFFIGIHFLDLMRWLLKADAEKVYATGIKYKLKKLGINTFDYIQAKVEFENKTSICFDTSFILPQKFNSNTNQGLKLVGTEGFWEDGNENRGVKIYLKDIYGVNNAFWVEGKDKLGRTTYAGYGFDGIRGFVDAVRHIKEGGAVGDFEKWTYATGEDGKQATKIALAIHKSIEEERIVYLSELEN